MKVNLMNKAHLLALGIAGMACTVAAAEKPNILFIFADDLSYETIGAYGMLDIDTPHLDTLVQRGVSFTHAYNMGAWNGAVCVASRRMLNTGNFVWRAQEANLEQYVSDRKMWAQRLQDAGYRTYMSGKWHIPTPPEGVFDVVVHERPGMPNQTESGYNRPKDEAAYEQGWKPWDTSKEGFWKGGKHWSEVLADDGIAFLEQASKEDQPFFMYLAFNAAHDPRQAPKEYVDRYPLERIKVPENMLPEYPYAEAACGKGLRDERLAPYPRTEYSVKVNRQEYFALITHMDDQIGRILDALEKTGQADNTYIVFTADHGLAVGHHGFIGKQNMYEDSIRAPFLITGPGIKAGTKIDTSIYLQDAMPTTLGWAGANADGVEFKGLQPLLEGTTASHYESIYGAYIKRQRMIIQDGWKLIVYPAINVKRLYNLKADPMEMNDLAAQPEHAEKIRTLTAALLKEMKLQDDALHLSN
jgi:choline-sulfatase